MPSCWGGGDLNHILRHVFFGSVAVKQRSFPKCTPPPPLANKTSALSQPSVDFSILRSSEFESYTSRHWCLDSAEIQTKKSFQKFPKRVAFSQLLVGISLGSKVTFGGSKQQTLLRWTSCDKRTISLTQVTRQWQTLMVISFFLNRKSCTNFDVKCVNVQCLICIILAKVICFMFYSGFPYRITHFPSLSSVWEFCSRFCSVVLLHLYSFTQSISRESSFPA